MNYSPQVHKLYELGNGLYYAEFNMHIWTFDETDSSNEAASIDTWTSEQEAGVSEKVPGYAVLRKIKTNAGYDWRYWYAIVSKSANSVTLKFKLILNINNTK